MLKVHNICMNSPLAEYILFGKLPSHTLQLHFFYYLSVFSCAWRTFIHKDILVKLIVLSSIFIPLKHFKYEYVKIEVKRHKKKRKQVKNTSAANKIFSQQSGSYTSCHMSLWIFGEYSDIIMMGISVRIQI